MASLQELHDAMETHALEHDVCVHSIVLDDVLATSIAAAERVVQVLQVRLTSPVKKPDSGTADDGTPRLDSDAPEESLADQLTAAQQLLDRLYEQAQPKTVDVVFRRRPVAEYLSVWSPRLARINKTPDTAEPGKTKNDLLLKWFYDLAAKSFAEIRLGGDPVEDGDLGRDIYPHLREGDYGEILQKLRHLNEDPAGRGPLAHGRSSPAVS